ncbi:hypothetical protein CEP52_014278 [Fusarium oligoseptatum]|uniref:ATP-grasp domain-containing protein n=1 Tax=Fusarium oligoseptatum TaxID=2604345 RepID=A0A428SNS4_9HYPO|nr:hypothetical protein CEP52_014278 [Fusarium oligoseptatum]
MRSRKTRESPLTVAFIYDRKVEHIAHGESLHEYADLADDVTIGGITEALERLGHRVVHVPGIKALVKDLAAHKHKHWDVVFNYSKGSHGTARETQVPALLEEYQIPFTFSDAETLTICGDKAKTKMVLDHYQIPTSQYVVVPKYGDDSFDYTEVHKKLSYPLFVKPTSSSQCNGITAANKIVQEQDPQHEVEKLRSQFKDQEILIENFLGGREFTVAISGTGEFADVIGISELVWDTHLLRGRDKIHIDFTTELSRRERCVNKGFTLENVPSSDPLWGEVVELGLKAYTALGCRDGGRVDIRLTSEEQGSAPCVIEVDPIFGMRPDRSRYALIAKSNEVAYHDLIQEFLDSAIQRHESMERGTVGI